MVKAVTGSAVWRWETGLTSVPSSPASLTGSQLSAEPSRSAPPRGRWPQFVVLCRAECGGDPGGFRVSLTVFVSPRMRRQACRSSSGSRTHTTPGHTALRDADQSPRVDILLPGGDGGLSPLLTCSSNVTMLTFYSLVLHTSRCINLRLHRDRWLSFPPLRSHRTSNAGLFVLNHRRTSDVISTMIWRL